MKKSSFLIAGKHAVTEALKNPNRKVLNVFLTEDSKKKLNKENQNTNLLENIKLFYKTKNELDRLCSKDQISHQGLIAEVEHLEKINIKDYLSGLTHEKKNITFDQLTYINITHWIKEIKNPKDYKEDRPYSNLIEELIEKNYNCI